MKYLAFAASAALTLASVSLSDLPAMAGNDPGATTFNVQNMTFDMWCQDTQRYSYERCEARNPQDQKDFETYRSTVENYEIQYLQDHQADAEFQKQLTRGPTPGATHTTDFPN